MEQEYNIQKIYDQDLFNRYYLYKNVNFNVGNTYGSKLLAGAFILLLKIGLSRLYRKKKSIRDSIFIIWGPLHKKRAKDLEEDFRIVEYKRLSFLKEQLEYFAHISIKELYRFVAELKKSEVTKLENSSRYLIDSLSYRILFVTDFLVLRSIATEAKKIYMAGYNDRPSLIISKICEAKDIHLTLLQHGVLGKKERWMHLKANRFFYLYPFSRPYVKHQIVVTPETELHHLPKKSSSLDLKTFNKGIFEKNIAYATSPADSDQDVKILKYLKKELFKKKYNLLIYPHPLEPEDTYKNLEVDLSAFVTRERHRNISYLLSRYSTLGMDYYEQGIEPVFLDYEKHTMDFLDSDSFIKFNDPESFYEWVETEL